MPGADLGKGIGADEKEQLVAGCEAGAYFLDGIDGIAALGAFLDAGNFEAWIALAGQLSHTDTVFEGRVSHSRLMGRVSGRDEQHAIEMKARGGLSREGEMAVVNRIE